MQEGNKKIFPDSVINQSTQQLFYENSSKSRAIYNIVLLFIVIAFVSLNFISVDISVKAGGMIRPKGERSIITAPNDGRIAFYNMAENLPVQKGDTLFAVVSDLISAGREAVSSRMGELENMIADLELLVKSQDKASASQIKSDVYRREFTYYKGQVSELKEKISIAERAYSRSKKLYDNKVISASEFDPVKAEYTAAKSALKTFSQNKAAQWTSNLDSYRTEFRNLSSQLRQIDIQNSQTVVLSPVSGTIQIINNLSENTYIHAGQQILEISPDGDLMVECYVNPKDIGLLDVGQKAKVQVSAFNYSDWGMLDGCIDEIFDDIILSQDQTAGYYRVYCTLDRDYLQLKNGYKGYIKKGMSVGVQFIVTKRTLWQLLRNKAGNWLNPNIVKEEEHE